MSGKNNFMLTILGSGTCVPSLSRSSCSILVETAGKKLLFDSGAGTIRRLLENNTGIKEITHIFYSHIHPDHTGEFVTFLFASKYPELIRMDNPLTIVAGKGFKKFYEGLRQVYGTWVELNPDIFRIVELDTMDSDVYGETDFLVRTLPVDHRPESLAFRVESEGKSIVYSGDTDVCNNLVRLAEKTDLFVCESSTPDSLKMEKHLSPSLAGEIATRAQVKKLVLTHFYPECDKTDIAKECRKTYKGDLVLAEDLMKFKL